MSDTTLHELKAIALTFGADVSATKAKCDKYGNGDDGPIIETFTAVLIHFARLSPRNRYLLARAVFVLFDIEAEIPLEAKR